MSRLDRALSRLAERGDPIGSDVLIARLERQLTSEPVPGTVTLETRRRAMETTPTTIKQPTPWWRRSRVAIGVAAAIVFVGIATYAIAGLTDSKSDAAANDAATTIDAYIDAYNTGDIDAVMALFSEDSVMNAHPMDDEAIGLAAIRAVQVQDLAAAAAENAYTISNLQVAGSTVTWDHVWTARDGRQSCQYGHIATVEDGKILSWTWPGGGFSCLP